MCTAAMNKRTDPESEITTKPDVLNRTARPRASRPEVLPFPVVRLVSLWNWLALIANQANELAKNRARTQGSR